MSLATSDLPTTDHQPEVGPMLTLSEWSDAEGRRAPFGPAYPQPLSFELAFTQRHRETARLGPAAREVAALELLFPTILQPLRPNDRFAGRIVYPMVGLSPEPGGFGYYCRRAAIEALIAEGTLGPDQTEAARDMLAYWADRTTEARARAALPAEVSRKLVGADWMEAPGVAFPLFRLAGTVLDYGRLLRLGLPGLQTSLAASSPGTFGFHACAALACLDRSLLRYAVEAETLATTATTLAGKQRHTATATRLRNLLVRTPGTLEEAIQLLWIYALHTGTWNYGRLDDVLGPFLARDLASGLLDEEEATTVLADFWRLIAAYSSQYNNRVIVGGRGRSHVRDADLFAMLAMEATRRVRLNQPQLTLRFHAGQNPALYARALDMLGEGCTFPLLYNDDVYVPSVQRAYGVAESLAEQYVPYGCGETAFAHRSLSSPNGVINLVECLRETLLDADDVNPSFPTFEHLWRAYASRAESYVEALARQQRIGYDVAGKDAPFLLLSLLIDNCAALGRGICQGGVQRLDGCVETYGNTNVADSLTAINQIVYEERRATIAEVIAFCREGPAWDADLWSALVAAPKFGNDHPAADAMARRVHEQICAAAAAQAKPARLDAYLVVIINNWGNTVLGRNTGASPDGRKAGDPFANANNPSSGQDRRGTTAFLHSLVKLDPGIHAGSVQNMKFSRSLFTKDRPRLEALLATYWKLGGSQAMITVLDRDDLLAAMREPEKWGHLMVRVGGFSIRFIDLPRAAQCEILTRTLHE